MERNQAQRDQIFNKPQVHNMMTSMMISFDYNFQGFQKDWIGFGFGFGLDWIVFLKCTQVGFHVCYVCVYMCEV
jgi:hypothetical protein